MKPRSPKLTSTAVPDPPVVWTVCVPLFATPQSLPTITVWSAHSTSWSASDFLTRACQVVHQDGRLHPPLALITLFASIVILVPAVNVSCFFATSVST